MITQRERTLWVVTINRPQKRNCVDAETAELLQAAATMFRDDDSLDVMLLSGAGDQAFCSGADLTDVKNIAGRADAWTFGPMGFTHMQFEKPIIAAINGYCTAGGLELACFCDFRIADQNAQFGVLNRRFGVPLIDGGTQRLPRIVGLGNALYLIETGVLLDAAQALRMGLVQEVVEPGGALRRAREIAAAMVTYPKAAMRNDRKAVFAGLNLSLKAGIAVELQCHKDALADVEMAAGLERFSQGARPQPLKNKDGS